MTARRVVLIIIDACGVGELPDAAQYGDRGAATLPNTAREVRGLTMPVCTRMGLGNIVPIEGLKPPAQPEASYGRMAEKSAGKDSTTGHWEIGGLISATPFPLFPDGFPEPLVEEFERRAGVRTTGNVAASGTEIISRLGGRHLKTGEIILYTSADSVFQLAAHEEVCPLERLYDICQVARRLLTGEYGVARVIARPFIGAPGNFSRTAGRKDFSLPPPSPVLPDLLMQGGLRTLAIGKVWDLFARRGFTQTVKAANNAEVMEAVIEAVENDTQHQLIFANCVDFDMLWGHRNDTAGFARALQEFDGSLGRLVEHLRPEDVLIITADHGCDPTLEDSTDHTREYVPLLVYGAEVRRGVNLGTRQTFADVACSVAEFFGIEYSLAGSSFLDEVLKSE
ncbi:MAG: phosphopentomutase [Candidatus Zixiibacteriota bacterium]|nr:MAG: phosphopentomutase [candidate division Zixibacteria bacterium]